MRSDTASVATPLADASAITPFRRFLRRNKLGELPQLWNVRKGEMSLVGLRPYLFNQKVLMAERAEREVFDVRPGITGLAQIQSIDMSPPSMSAEVDAQIIKPLTLSNYFRHILLTVLGKGAGDRVKGSGA